MFGTTYGNISSSDNYLGPLVNYDALLTSIGAVLTWVDNASGFNVAQATGAKQPVNTVNKINGRPGLVFNGTSSTLTNTTATNLLLVPNGANTSFVVGFTNADTTFQDFYAIADGGGARNRLSCAAASQTVAFDNGNVSQVTQGSIVKTSPIILTGRRSGTSQFVSVNGGAENTNTNALSASGATIFAVGSDSDTSFYLNGVIGQILIYNRSLSSSEIAHVVNLLKTRWGF